MYIDRLVEIAAENYEQYVQASMSSVDMDAEELRDMSAAEAVKAEEDDESIFGDDDDDDDDDDDVEDEDADNDDDDDDDDDEDEDADNDGGNDAGNDGGENVTFTSDDEDGYDDAVEEGGDNDGVDEALVEGLRLEGIQLPRQGEEEALVVITGTPDEDHVPVAASTSSSSSALPSSASALPSAASSSSSSNNHHNDHHNTTTTLSSPSIPQARPPILAFATPPTKPSRYVIEGLKITGDPNVPAGQLSFFVEVTNGSASDFQTWLIVDERPIVSFDSEGGVAVTFMADRINNIRSGNKTLFILEIFVHVIYML